MDQCFILFKFRCSTTQLAQGQRFVQNLVYVSALCRFRFELSFVKYYIIKETTTEFSLFPVYYKDSRTHLSFHVSRICFSVTRLSPPLPSLEYHYLFVSRPNFLTHFQNSLGFSVQILIYKTLFLSVSVVFFYQPFVVPVYILKSEFFFSRREPLYISRTRVLLNDKFSTGL